MESDLDNVLNCLSGAKQSKRPRASQRVGHPFKVPKRTEATPPPPDSQGPSQAAAADPEVGVSTEVTLPLPPAIQTSHKTAPAPKKLVPTRECLLSISTHSSEYVINNVTGKHGATLGSDVLSRVGQSFSNLSAPSMIVPNYLPRHQHLLRQG